VQTHGNRREEEFEGAGGKEERKKGRREGADYG